MEPPSPRRYGPLTNPSVGIFGLFSQTLCNNHFRYRILAYFDPVWSLFWAKDPATCLACEALSKDIMFQTSGLLSDSTGRGKEAVIKFIQSELNASDAKNFKVESAKKTFHKIAVYIAKKLPEKWYPLELLSKLYLLFTKWKIREKFENRFRLKIDFQELPFRIF